MAAVSIIDYGIGNVWSVMSAMNFLGVDAELVATPEGVQQAHRLILPGVGSFRNGMEALIAEGFDCAIREAVLKQGVPILGICLGMQLLGSESNEFGQISGLGLVPNKVGNFSPEEVGELKIPHVGFNHVEFAQAEGLFWGFEDGADFYFTHSYRMLPEKLGGRQALCTYGIPFLAAFEVDNICGTQFHPEKSQTSGLKLLKNFLNR